VSRKTHERRIRKTEEKGGGGGKKNVKKRKEKKSDIKRNSKTIEAIRSGNCRG